MGRLLESRRVVPTKLARTPLKSPASIVHWIFPRPFVRIGKSHWKRRPSFSIFNFWQPALPLFERTDAIVPSTQFARLAQSVLELDRLLEELRTLAGFCGVPSPESQDWYALLKHKLIPQLSEQAVLIVAIMGGTNTGKSLVFNQLVGECFSAVDHHASGTKHPVCLVPVSEEGDANPSAVEAALGRHFDAFRLLPWARPEQSLEENDQDFLFWTTGQKVPKRLWILDTPDIDSDRQVNWARARGVRHAADVLIGVVTREKYNDAAVRRFFREAAEADKPLILLFNMLDLDEDAEHLPRWMEQFEQETGARPLAVVVAPHDRQAASELRLAFLDYQSGKGVAGPVSIEEILTQLHFDAIKSQTLLGAIRVLNHPEHGVRAYLDTVRQASGRFAEALNTLENAGETDIRWPALPSPILVEEIRAWWNEGRPNWSQNINRVYRTVGGGLLWPVRKATQYVSTNFFGGKPKTQTPLEEFREQENESILEFVTQVIYRLEELAETENPVLRREILELIGGENRVLLLDRARRVLGDLEPVDASFRRVLQRHLTEWSEKNPKALGWLRSLDTVTTVARPVITVTLAATGFVLGAQLVGQVVGEAAIAGGVTAGGEAVLHAGSETTQQQIARLFGNIQRDFVLARSQRFYEEFRKDIWNDVIDRLRTGATVTETEVFRRCVNWTPEPGV